MATLCSANEKVTDHKCVACGAGLANLAGNDATGASTECTSCATNYHVTSSASTAVCKACLANTFNDRCAGSSGCDLLTGGDTTCLSNNDYCAVDEKRINNACVSCGIGTEQKAKVAKTGAASTTCSAILCLANEYVSSNVCKACGAGTFIPAGGDASKTDTVCVVKQCSVDFHVKDKACVACSNGLFRAEGDDTSMENTACTANTCGVDELVDAMYKCVACPVGTTRPAGSKTDTDQGKTCTSTCTANQHTVNSKCSTCPAGTTHPGKFAHT